MIIFDIQSHNTKRQLSTNKHQNCGDPSRRRARWRPTVGFASDNTGGHANPYGDASRPLPTAAARDPPPLGPLRPDSANFGHPSRSANSLAALHDSLTVDGDTIIFKNSLGLPSAFGEVGGQWMAGRQSTAKVAAARGTGGVGGGGSSGKEGRRRGGPRVVAWVVL
ncbi:hypothetical protein NL676_017366 [Syzygium grande]|nr:hypothetical protein NL676_017366 [Syzygium grande]